jgi:hydrogenase expression/formation protein HypE
MKDDIILMAHGGGGVLTRKIIDELVVGILGNPILNKLDDGACLSIPENELVMTTDSFVVTPMFFPGGDIGKLAICGTVNDLAMQGAVPRYMSLGLIIEEGLLIEDLRRVLLSIKEAADLAGALIVTGDTKVVERSRGQKSGGRGRSGAEMFINTTGIGVRLSGVDVSVGNARAGDAVIVTGTIGDHGMAVMTRREGLEFESELVSDVAALWDLEL